MRWTVQNLLKQLDITRVSQAGSKTEAMDKLVRYKFDLVISDHHMDNGTGLDLLREVRSHPLTRKLPFIMLTGNAEPETVSAVGQAGVNNYIVKPVSLETLKKRIEQVLGPLK